MLDMIGFIGMEVGYIFAGVFYTIAFPCMNYLASINSLIGKIRFPISVYSAILGILYLLSGYYIAKRKRRGLKLAVLVNLLGIILIFPIGIGLASLYYFTRPKVKEQFK